MQPPREQVVAVVAHPDDAELMCYGTLLRYREQGAAVTVVVVTTGVNGVSLTDRDRGVSLTGRERTGESAASYAGSGIDLVTLGFADGALAPDRELVSRIEAELARLGCTVLITHSLHAGPDHQDHLAVAQAAVNAATRIGTCATILHGQPHAPRGDFHPTVLVDITDLLPDKVKALTAHRSQAGRWYLGEDFTRHRAAAAGWSLAPVRAAAGRRFEAFETSLITLLAPEEDR
ncbi:PIG-L family deacetylase [Kitasatospora sp. YST-16]|uniref:PIG-L deacetylase family protein n=1 Tax=Kitasatospora sp. YST-16 TaxID=2998080 RepID=UPI00228368FE|nr:PIG-L family deacetylase [Kitasatospora sp. YST-16]WAL74554.1 PIG-L family deacetylase [Kitasatospora sp. YST-16]WNW40612.1 PIG-L family deacetylase [Streptomyces sp. Li-HN-5-13]